MFLGRRQPGPYAFVIGMCSRRQRSSSSRTPLASSATGSSSTWATPGRASGRLPAFASRSIRPRAFHVCPGPWEDWRAEGADHASAPPSVKGPCRGEDRATPDPYSFMSTRRQPGATEVEPLTEDGVYQAVRDAVQRENLGRRIHPHLLRSSAITDWRWETGPIYPGNMPDAMIDEEIFRLVLAWAADQPHTKVRGLSVWEISDQLTHRVVIPAVKRLHQARLIEVSNDATVVLGLTAEGKASAAR